MDYYLEKSCGVNQILHKHEFADLFLKVSTTEPSEINMGDDVNQWKNGGYLMMKSYSLKDALAFLEVSLWLAIYFLLSRGG